MHFLIMIMLFGFWNLSLSQNNIDSTRFNIGLKDFNLDNSLVIFGEAHEVAGTYDLETFLINEFVKKGYSTIIIEGGKSEATILNQYMKTGNEGVLQFTRAKGENYKKLILAIREIDNKLRFKGVDFERGICLEYLFDNWFKDINTPNLKNVINKLQKIDSKISAKKLKKILISVQEEFTQQEEFFNDLLKENSKILKEIIFNPVFQADFGMSSKKRDKSIVQNLVAIPNNDLTKSILIFGSNHFTNKGYFWENFAATKKQELESVLILFAYQNCTNHFISLLKQSSMKTILC